MTSFLVKRLASIIPTLLVVSVVAFFVLKVQPGSALDQYLDDPRMTPEAVERIRVQLGLDRSAIEQYFSWIWGIVSRGDFGQSFKHIRPVSSLIGDYLGWTIFVSAITLVISWLVAVPLGIFVAVRRNGITDAIASFIGYIGVAVPDFLIALLLVSLILRAGGTNVGGLFSKEYIDAPWSFAKFLDLLRHLWLPIIVIGAHNIAGLMRQMRANLLDVLHQDYVRTARSKGLAERIVVYRHAVRNALNPLISIAGLSMPELINGTIIASIVLNLPTIGPLLYDSIIGHDQYVVMTLLLLSAVLLMVGN
ncbi:MAG TPA: ABC transporter permease, partial [Deinococcales bacterium]|nr:ABC transporter permease [Deinococcales bacterium]